jgi:voltage-gated potassium channel
MFFRKIIIKLALYLYHNNQYKNVKKFFFNILQNPDYAYKKYFDTFMISLILVSIGILVYEVKHPVPIWIDDFDIYLVTFIFSLEYIIRFWVYNDLHTLVIKEYEESNFLNRPFNVWSPIKIFLQGKWELITSISSIIDLLAILPAYRPLRVLRIFILFRVFKLLRYTKSIHQFVEVLDTKRFELYTLLFLLLFIVSTAGIAIYVFEQQSNPNINSMFDALYWALVTISSVGYGDISPVTPEGRVVSMLIIISGIAMISFVTSVIVSAFSEKLTELKENRIIEQINKNDSFIIICGYGQMTRMFLKSSNLLNTEYVIIEKELDRVELGVKEGYSIIHDDASKHDVISRFNISFAKITILALTGSDVNNIYITLNAKALSRNIKVIARASNTNMEKKCKLAGVDHVVLPNMVANHMLLFAITQPTIYHAVYNILTDKYLAHIDEVNSVTHTKLLGKRVKDIKFKAFKILLLGIQSSNDAPFCFNPSLCRVVKHGDILLVMGRKMSIDYFQSKFREV